MANPLGDSPAAEANPLGDSAVGGIAVEDLGELTSLPQGMTEADAAFLREIGRGRRTEPSFSEKRLKPAIEGALAPAFTLPEVPELTIPGRQLEADVVVGLYNGLKAIPEAITAPIGSVLIPLGMAEAVSPIAKALGKAAQVYFAGDLAQAGGAESADALSVLNDPKATNQQKLASVTKAASTLGLSATIGVHAASGLNYQPVKIDVMGPDGAPREIELPAAQAAKRIEDQAKADIDAVYKQAGVERPKDASPETLAREELNAKVAKNPLGDEPFVAATAEALAPEQKALPVEVVAPEPEVRFSVYREQKNAAGDTQPGAVQIDRQADATGKPMSDGERKQFPSPEDILATDLPQGNYSLEQVNAAVSSTKNAKVAMERAERNLPPPEPADVRKIAEAKAEAERIIRENPTAADDLIAEIKASDRGATDVENFILLERQVRVEAAFKEADILARDAATPEAKAIADANLQRVGDELLDVYNAGQKAGTEQARGLNARKAAVFEDFTLAQMVTLERAAKGGERLTPKEATENAALHEQISTLQRQLDERRAVETEAPAARTSRIVQVLSERADLARERIRERMRSGQVSAGIDPTLLRDYAEIGAYHLARGIEKGAKWSAEMVKEFGDTVKPHLAAIFSEAEKVRAEAMSAKADASKLQAYKTRTFNRALEIENKAAIGDLEATPRKKLVLDKEALLIQAKLEAAKAKFAERLEQHRFDRLSAIGKLREEGLRTYDSARNIMTTGEFSFVLRQGGFSGLAHPVIAAKSLPASFRALLGDEVKARAIDLETLSHPDAPAARAAKLHLVEAGSKLSRQEEIYASKWAEKIPVVRNFNQAARVFLNKLRFDVWRTVREASNKTPMEDAQLAKFVNESTGRGSLGGAEAAAVALGRVLFSPRYLASRIQLLVGHSMWGGNWTTRRIIAKEYAKTLVGLGVVYSLLNQLGGSVNLDPRSSDFGKLKFGNTRLDPLMGLAQLTVFGARTATGEKTNTKGKTRPIRGNVPYGGDKWSDVAVDFARSKLHPVPGSVVDLFDGTDLVGRPATPAGEALDLIRPITYEDIYLALEEQDLPTGVALSLLAMFGMGLQNYEQKKPKEKKPNPANK